jgi:Uma2 family endonuclease
MQRHAERHYTIEDYFAIEEGSEIKHEYFDGEVFAMAGASLRHNLITGNVFASLRTRIAGSSCRAFGSDLRLRTPGGLLTYPGVSVICGRVELSRVDRLDTVLNPIVIVEVLSESTRDYDRGQKSRLYREIPTLLDYVLVEQSRVYVEHLSLKSAAADRATDDSWTRRIYEDMGQVASIASLSVDLPLGEIYEWVDLTLTH